MLRASRRAWLERRRLDEAEDKQKHYTYDEEEGEHDAVHAMSADRVTRLDRPILGEIEPHEHCGGIVSEGDGRTWSTARGR